MLNKLSKFSLLILTLGFISIISGFFYVGIYDTYSFMELIASLSGITCVVLVTNKNKYNFIFGFIQCMLYAFISLKYHYYGEFILNLFFFVPMQFVGFYNWNKNSKYELYKKEESIKVQKLSNYEIVMLILISLVTIYILGYYFISLGGNRGYIDASTNVLSVIGQLLMTYRYREQWLCWISINILTIYMWFRVVDDTNGGAISVLIMWSIFLINSIYGFITWNKNSK